ncbi:hypothetical protein BT93_F1123 [Corymbia citriodora subsp. variegata]|nr:hypothetical protein BT93_F1123 [Corymbia citriodora subsp. variegata]
MPRAEDIAWKFVIRRGKKWHCPYCEKEYSGSVTRVKSHFLKQPKEGIASCTKVPERISTLMELVHNQVHNKEDIAWKFVDRLEDNKWHCHYCSGGFFGDLTRVKGHLLKVPNEGISVCTEVPDHIRKLMRSLLDEVAEEETREANGQSSTEPKSRDMPIQAEVAEEETREANSQSSTEPKSRDMPIQAEVAEEESREANGQLSTEPKSRDMPIQAEVAEEESGEANSQCSMETQSRDMLPPTFFLSPQSFEYRDHLFTTPEGATSMTTLTSDPLEGECQFHQSSTMLSRVQNNRDILEQPALVPPQHHRSVPHESINHETRNVQQNITMPLDKLDATQQPDLSSLRLDATYGNKIASSLQQLSMDLQFSFSLDRSEQPVLLNQQTHLEIGNEQYDQVLDYSLSNWLQEFNADATAPDAQLFSTDQSNLFGTLPQNLFESRDLNIDTSEKIKMNELHNPTVGSSLQNDSSLDVENTNHLQHSQSCVVEVIPIRSLTNTVQQTSMDIDSSIASQHASDSHIFEATYTTGPSSSQASVPPQCQSVPHQSISLKTGNENPPVPSSWNNHSVTCHPQDPMDTDPCIPLSSSQAPKNTPPLQIVPCGTELDKNKGVPMISHPNTDNNSEENGVLKRRLKQFYSREAHPRDGLEYAATIPSQKKYKREVANWLADVEKPRNDFPCNEAASENCLPPHQKVILMQETEDHMGHSNCLNESFEVRETKFSKFLLGRMVGDEFQRNTTKILKYLERNEISRLGIYGMGGVGKTTIMKNIYNELLRKKDHGNVLWITVSQDCSTQKLQDNIWEALGSTTVLEKDESKRAATLSEKLTERGKSIIILDDVWAYFELEQVGIPVGVDEIKLVLTTRSIDVCHKMQCQEKIKIKPLSDKEGESLFMEELGSEVALDLKIKAIAKSIVKECAGLPLGVIVMARSMRGVTDVFEWKDFLVKLKESDMGQTDMEKYVLMILKFSYDCLGSNDVQQCFLSCALYPEDEYICKTS